jgi:hypothetical protein
MLREVSKQGFSKGPNSSDMHQMAPKGLETIRKRKRNIQGEPIWEKS